VATHTLELDDTEIKMLLAAIRQVQHTFSIAEAQSSAAGEPLASDYDNIREAYAQLHQKLSDLGGPNRPYLVK
jgi:hypothetical protein